MTKIAGMLQVCAGIGMAIFQKGSCRTVNIDKGLSWIYFFCISKISLGSFRVMLFQADKAPCGIGFCRGRKPNGMGGIIESLVKVAEIAQGKASQKIGGRVQGVFFYGFIEKCRSLFWSGAFSGICPKLSRLSAGIG